MYRVRVSVGPCIFLIPNFSKVIFFYKNGILLNENHPYISIADVYQFFLPLDQNDAPAKQISNFLPLVEL